MSEANRRKKRPEKVRRQLLEAGVKILIEQGARAMTLDAVAHEIGVTKSGLIHHFPNREALLNGMFDFILEHYERMIECFMADDPEPEGRFTRAYLRTNLQTVKIEKRNKGIPIYLAVMADETLRQRMRDWFNGEYRQYARNEHFVGAEIVRFAADGLWLSETFGERRISMQARKKVIEKLIEMTYLH